MVAHYQSFDSENLVISYDTSIWLPLQQDNDLDLVVQFANTIVLEFKVAFLIHLLNEMKKVFTIRIHQLVRKFSHLVLS